MVHEAHTQQVFELLGRGEIDLGLVHVGRADAGDAIGSEAARGGVVLLRMYREPLVVIVAPTHQLAQRTSVRLDDIDGDDFVAFAPGATVRQLVTAAAAARGVNLRIVCLTANLGTVRAVVSAGLGVSIIPASGADVPWPELRVLALSAPRLERIVTLARSSGRYQSPAMAALRHALPDDLGALDSRGGPHQRPRSRTRS